MTALSVRAAARERSGDPALIDARGATTWSELARDVEACIERLASIGIDGRDPETRIAVIGAPERERVIDVLAAIELGVPLVMLHPRWTREERRAVVAECAPRIVLGDDSVERRETRPNTTDRAVVARTAVNSGSWMGGSCPLAILHTSGTTGRAKGAILSRDAFVAAARASHATLPLGPRDRWLLCMPIAHVGGLSIVVRCLIARAAVVIAGPFDVERVRASMGRDRPTLVSLVPTMLARLLDAGWRGHDELRAVLLGGAACPDRVLERAIEAGLPIRTTYGLTEACSQVTTSRVDVRAIDEGAGEPLPGIEVRIDDGTIRVRGASMLSGWFPPGAHPAPLDAEGWYDTGDLGRFDARGRLHVLARRTDLIVTGGENVYPAEVEAALERVPGVRAACVFGVPDDTWGQLVAAAIVVGDDADDDRAVVTTAAATLARFKLPRRIARVEGLVVAASGKLDRRATAERACSLLRAIDV